MYSLVFNVLMLCFIVVYVVDISGFMFNISKVVYNIFNPGKVYMGQIIKPFGCSLCLTFWLVLIYLLYSSIPFIPSMFIACICSLFSVPLKNILKYIVYIFNKK